MFFSNQLLCRKGPLGQIWIVATMQSKLNRKKAEQINIEEICMQVLQPQVPLALRLTGILMGGIVLIYDRKVRILHEDVNEFLFKLKTAVDNKAHSDKQISLPRAKLHARFENVTISYDFDNFEDIERAMHAPGKPGREEPNMGQEEYVVSSAVDPYRRLSSSGDSKRVSSSEACPDVQTVFPHQVSSEDITLEERNLSSSLHERYEDMGMEFRDDRIPPSDNLFLDDFFPEIQATVEIPPDPLPRTPSPQIDTECEPEAKTTTAPSGQQDSIQPELDGSIALQEEDQQREPNPGQTAPENLRKRRVRRAGVRRAIFDQGPVEIPAPVFASWIRDTSDIRKRHKKTPVGKDPEAARAQRHLDLPSVSLFSPTCIQGLEPFWAPQLTKLWERTLTGKVPLPTEGGVPEFKGRRGERERLVMPSTPIRLSAQSSDPLCQTFEARSEDKSSPRAYSLNAETAGHFNAEFMQADHTAAERFQEPNDLRDCGSVEKLRTALQTPSAGSDEFWSNIFAIGRTPGYRHTRSDKSRSTVGSGASSTLPLDPETDLPSDSSGRFKRPRRSGSFRSTSPNTLDNLPPGLDGVGSSYNFFANRAASLSRFNLTEETQRDTAQEPMRVQVSSSLLQYLIDGFNQNESRLLGYISLFEISEGLGREEAARLFYQICVLGSNRFLTLNQKEPYGDILLGRGLYL